MNKKLMSAADKKKLFASMKRKKNTAGARYTGMAKKAAGAEGPKRRSPKKK